jgi:hypothetical protein
MADEWLDECDSDDYSESKEEEEEFDGVRRIQELNREFVLEQLLLEQKFDFRRSRHWSDILVVVLLATSHRYQ